MLALIGHPRTLVAVPANVNVWRMSRPSTASRRISKQVQYRIEAGENRERNRKPKDAQTFAVLVCSLLQARDVFTSGCYYLNPASLEMWVDGSDLYRAVLRCAAVSLPHSRLTPIT